MMIKLSKPMQEEEYEEIFNLLCDACYSCRILRACKIDDDDFSCGGEDELCREHNCIVQQAFDNIDVLWEKDIAPLKKED